jgi:hypothetical protein
LVHRHSVRRGTDAVLWNEFHSSRKRSLKWQFSPDLENPFQRELGALEGILLSNVQIDFLSSLWYWRRHGAICLT